jgi:glycosyltransferase involved in cell wall biosynthesis
LIPKTNNFVIKNHILLSTSNHIYINGRFLCQTPTGVQKYAIGICKALQKNHPGVIIICPNKTHNNFGLRIKKSGIGKGFFWEQVWLPWFFLFRKQSLLINLCNTAPLLKRKQIVTVHDLAFLKDKKWFSPTFRNWYKFLIPRICERSVMIITVSDFIKNEISNEFKIHLEKIKVIHNGIPEFCFDDRRPFPFRYLLLTGIYNPRKNASFVISQLPEIKKRNYHIVGVGADENLFLKPIFQPDENLHLLKYVDDKKYFTLMKHADALVFPSEYEGFGIPVLEALCLGTPVIVPDIEVYRESFCDLPMYYPAGDENGFLNVLDNINIKKLHINELSDLKNKYTFDKSAEMMLGIVKCYQNKN